MTHTLHPEIEEAIEKMIKDMELPAEVGAKLFIIQSLGKYLHMPQPIENEPLPEKLPMDENKIFVIGNGHPEPVIDKYANGYVGTIKQYGIVTQGKDLSELFKNINEAIALHFEEEQKQSTPQIELPAYVLNNLDYLGLLLDKMIEKSKSHLDKLKSLDK